MSASLQVRTFGLSWPLLCGLLSLVWVLYGPPAASVLADADTYWHIAAGRWILENGAIPRADAFSHSMPGAPWVAHEWLAEVVLAGIHELAGWGGLAVLVAFIFAGTLTYLARFLVDRLEPIYALMFAVLAAVMMSGHLLARPHIFFWPLLAIWVGGLVTAGEKGERPPFRMLPLMVLWANLHGSFTLGLALALVLALDAVLQCGKQTRKTCVLQWGGFLALCLTAAMLTPWGWRGLWFPFELMGMAFATTVIGEWRSPDFQKLQVLEIWILLMLFLGWIGRGRLPLLRLIVILGLAHLALKHQRHISVLGLVSPFLLAAPLASHWRQNKGVGQDAQALDRFFAAFVSPARGGGLFGAGVLAAVLSAGALAPGHISPTAARTPEAAVRAAMAAGANGAVFNAYNFGGYLIYQEIPVFIDGRADMYGDALLKRYMSAVLLEDSDALPSLLADYDIRWTMLEPGTPALALLDRLPGWQRVHADDTAVVHVRDATVQ